MHPRTKIVRPPAFLGASALVCVLALAACSSADSPPAVSAHARQALTEAVERPEGDPTVLDALREAARQAPDDAVAQERYGLAAEQARRYPEALAALNRALAVGGAVPARLIARGRVAIEMGDIPAAALAYRQALERDPANIQALSGLGVTEDQENHHADAQAHYREALRLAPGDWGVRSNLALSLLMSDRPSDASAALAGAADDPVAPRRARQNLALALVAVGDRDKAVKILMKELPPAEASALASEFASFARWLATSPDARAPRQ